ncbi:MAG: NADH-quinone oxidoreductase subunit J [Bacteroidota bacterium]|nr:NADH-quinone oxidoreductase subunit J [Bacteroidota bacterium]MDP4229691.1 NADH-quinone oxidoreductase subunit J [Bacteroidota bacterium]MDP4235065.1 NADH-quinone oxidoreductase subunit J [Bacteroidota bacterium]
MNELIFWILSGGAIISALLMVTRKSAVPSALMLIVTFCFLAALYLTLNAQFLAVVQVAVYAGAIMVLVVFVIMLLNIRNEQYTITGNWKTVVGILGVLGILAQIISVFIAATDTLPKHLSESAVQLGTVESVGTKLYTSYAFPFEMASIILIAAAVGAIVLAKKKLT